MDDESTGQDGSEPSLPIDALIENLLFVAQEPVSVERLGAVLDISPEDVEAVLSTLSKEYDRHGLRLQRHGRQVQMVTAPEAADYVRRFLGLELTGKLSPAALETLAVVAYRQPAPPPDIEAGRGGTTD